MKSSLLLGASTGGGPLELDGLPSLPSLSLGRDPPDNAPGTLASGPLFFLASRGRWKAVGEGDCCNAASTVDSSPSAKAICRPGGGWWRAEEVSLSVARGRPKASSLSMGLMLSGGGGEEKGYIGRIEPRLIEVEKLVVFGM